MACSALRRLAAAIAIGAGLGTAAASRAAEAGYPARFDFGTTPTPQELARFFAIKPDGRGLPPGSGTYLQGQAIYAEQCAACHGEKLDGWSSGMAMPPEMAAMGDGRLVGGRGSLATRMPVFTVESYWPYATTLWDYIKRAMPQAALLRCRKQKCVAAGRPAGTTARRRHQV